MEKKPITAILFIEGVLHFAVSCYNQTAQNWRGSWRKKEGREEDGEKRGGTHIQTHTVTLKP